MTTGGSTKDLVDDVLDRCGSVDGHAVWDVSSRLMPAHNEVACRRLPAAPLGVRSLVEPSVQRGEVDLEDENIVE